MMVNRSLFPLWMGKLVAWGRNRRVRNDLKIHLTKAIVFTQRGGDIRVRCLGNCYRRAQNTKKAEIGLLHVVGEYILAY